jgi:SMC interacting uncharacterized protein involved in chromosome segregation
MIPTVEQLQEHANRLHRAIEAQTIRLIEVERENRELRATVEIVTAENDQLRRVVDAVKVAIAREASCC